MPTWKLTIEYDGTRYRGWQEQKNARTVAGAIRNAAAELFGQTVDLGGAGRTDAGVHALGQVAHLRSRKRVRAGELHRGLNGLLPSDINVLRVEEARPSFDARRDASARYYLYQISTRRSAFAKQFVWWVKDDLDVARMKTSVQALPGLHDFIAFCEKPAPSQSTLVVVERAEIGVEADLILIRIGASHFLWKMVRRLVGSLVEIGRGTISEDDFSRLLIAETERTYDVAAHTAPPSGLFLERVVYANEERPGRLMAAFPVRSWS